jgi:AcrR family transcriptional regulator
MGSQGVLTREGILDAALEIVDEVGVDRLRMRDLADRLGVTATAIYYYFEGREELVEGLVDHVCARILADVPGDGSPYERLTAMLVSLVDHAGAHPGASSWAITAYARRAPMLALHESMLELIVGSGLTLAQAIFVKAALLRYCIGHLVLEQADPIDDLETLSAELYPRTIRAQPIIDATDRRQQVRTALDAMIPALADAAIATITAVPTKKKE